MCEREGGFGMKMTINKSASERDGECTSRMQCKLLDPYLMKITMFPTIIEHFLLTSRERKRAR